jgi:hypothetical protein
MTAGDDAERSDAEERRKVTAGDDAEQGAMWGHLPLAGERSGAK